MFVNFLTHKKKYEYLYTKFNGVSYELDPKFMNRQSIFPDVIKDNKFKDYGFEKMSLSDSIKEQLANFVNGEYNQDIIDTLMNMLEIFLKDWSSKNIIMDTEIVTVDAVYRDTNPENKNMFTNIPLTHIDFDSFMTDTALLNPFMDRWGPRFSRKLGPDVYDIKYWNSGKKIIKICNTWVSLNETIENHHLGLIDIRTVNQKNIIEYVAKRAMRKNVVIDNKFGSRKETFIATALTYDENNKWFYSPDMKFGDALIFDSKNTPHASIDVESHSNSFRKSIEFRTVFIKKDINIPREIDNAYYSCL